MLDAAALRELLSKSGRVRRQARRRRASAGRDGPVGTACLLDRRRRSQDDPYRSGLPPDTELRTQLRDLANERKRFGYRRLFILLRQGGEPSGINRIYRLYCEEGLTVRKRRARRRAVGTRAPILAESKPNGRWSVDFVHDQFACSDDDRRSRRPERQLILCRRPSSTSTPSSVGIAQIMSAVACVEDGRAESREDIRELVQKTVPASKRRLNAHFRELRRVRIFMRLRDGRPYTEIAREEGLTDVRIRQIVSETLKKRLVDPPTDHAMLQLMRLEPALRLAAEAAVSGDIKAVRYYLKLLDQVDRRQPAAAAPQAYDDAAREAPGKDHMSGNLCRCAAYPNIVAAIEHAKVQMRRA